MGRLRAQWEIVPVTPRAKPTDPMLAGEIGRRLCGVFGLSPLRTKSITISLDASDVALVTVEQFITREQADELETVATDYGLHRAEPVRQLSPGFTIRDRR